MHLAHHLQGLLHLASSVDSQLDVKLVQLSAFLADYAIELHE
jgi:hypothetical protein